MPSKDKAKQRAWAAAHYQRNKEAMKARAIAHKRAHVAAMREYTRAIKESTPCADCGRNYMHYVMDYHHVGEKTMNVSDMVSQGFSLAKIQAEIVKCIVLCSNCHRIRTWNEAGEIAAGDD